MPGDGRPARRAGRAGGRQAIVDRRRQRVVATRSHDTVDERSHRPPPRVLPVERPGTQVRPVEATAITPVVLEAVSIGSIRRRSGCPRCSRGDRRLHRHRCRQREGAGLVGTVDRERLGRAAVSPDHRRSGRFDVHGERDVRSIGEAPSSHRCPAQPVSRSPSSIDCLSSSHCFAKTAPLRWPAPWMRLTGPRLLVDGRSLNSVSIHHRSLLGRAIYQPSRCDAAEVAGKAFDEVDGP